MIDALRGEHVGQASHVLAESHQDYPSFRHLFADPDRRRRSLRAFYHGVVRDAHRFGASQVAGRAGGALLGVALWLPPATYPWSGLRKVRAAPALLRVALAAPASLRAFARTGSNTERAHPAEPQRYLEVLGVRPEAQGDGVGTQLLGRGLARAGGGGLPCYRETAREQNVGYYARLGPRSTTQRAQHPPARHDEARAGRLISSVDRAVCALPAGERRGRRERWLRLSDAAEIDKPPLAAGRLAALPVVRSGQARAARPGCARARVLLVRRVGRHPTWSRAQPGGDGRA